MRARRAVDRRRLARQRRASPPRIRHHRACDRAAASRPRDRALELVRPTLGLSSSDGPSSPARAWAARPTAHGSPPARLRPAAARRAAPRAAARLCRCHRRRVASAAAGGGGGGSAAAVGRRLQRNHRVGASGGGTSSRRSTPSRSPSSCATASPSATSAMRVSSARHRHRHHVLRRHELLLLGRHQFFLEELRAGAAFTSSPASSSRSSLDTSGCATSSRCCKITPRSSAVGESRVWAATRERGGLGRRRRVTHRCVHRRAPMKRRRPTHLDRCLRATTSESARARSAVSGGCASESAESASTFASIAKSSAVAFEWLRRRGRSRGALRRAPSPPPRGSMRGRRRRRGSSRIARPSSGFGRVRPARRRPPRAAAAHHRRHRVRRRTDLTAQRIKVVVHECVSVGEQLEVRLGVDRPRDGPRRRLHHALGRREEPLGELARQLQQHLRLEQRA